MRANQVRTRTHEPPRVLHVDTVAGHLGITPHHVRRLAAKRRIPSLRWDGLIWFDAVALNGWLVAQRHEQRRAS